MLNICKLLFLNKKYNHVVLVPALRVEMVAQTRHYSRAVPDTDTILVGPDHAWAVFFRVVTGPAYRISAKWPSIYSRPAQMTTMSV
jgi:hypothetical protein